MYRNLKNILLFQKVVVAFMVIETCFYKMWLLIVKN